MSTSTVGANNNVIGKAETEFAKAAGTTDRVAADKGTFLKLLVAQLTHQDPLNPAEDKEFIAQLAQFTSLEQLQGINEGVGNLNTSMNQSQMVSATSFIGKDILANGAQITKVSDGKDIYTTDFMYTIDKPMAKGQVNVFDDKGNLVYSDTLTSKQAGTHAYNSWPGTNMNGKEVPDGTYKVIISCQDEDDKPVMPSTQFVGRVVGVENKDGVYSLVLAGGRTVKFTDVAEVYQSATTTADTPAVAAAKIIGNELIAEAKTEGDKLKATAKTAGDALIAAAQGSADPTAEATAQADADKLKEEAETEAKALMAEAEAKANKRIADAAKA